MLSCDVLRPSWTWAASDCCGGWCRASADGEPVPMIGDRRRGGLRPLQIGSQSFLAANWPWVRSP
jgi:hypothetical protein